MSDVPCGTCTACCRAFQIWLEPGDRAELYRTVPVPGRPAQSMLAKQADGSCFYLRESGCSIYESRPKGCQRFDCRSWVKINFPTRALRKDAARTNPSAEAVIARGRALLKGAGE